VLRPRPPRRRHFPGGAGSLAALGGVGGTGEHCPAVLQDSGVDSGHVEQK
jgi:hypothetical protein